MNEMIVMAKGFNKSLIKPECEIIVPTKELKLPTSLGEKIIIGSNVISMVSVVTLLINYLTK